MTSHVTHLESALDGTRFPAGQGHPIHQGRLLCVRSDLARVRETSFSDEFPQCGRSQWRYRELLPLPFDAEPVTLGEGMTPLLPFPQFGAALGLPRVRRPTCGRARRRSVGEAAVGHWPFTEASLRNVRQQTKPRPRAFLQALCDLVDLQQASLHKSPGPSATSVGHEILMPAECRRFGP